MLCNNLDNEVGEDPAHLVVYGGRGKAARDWESFHAIVDALRELRDDETLIVQSGKPVAVFPTHPGAPRVLIANSLLVPAVGHVGALLGAGSQGTHDVRADDGGKLDVHRHAGNSAGHVRDLRGLRAARNSSRSLAGPASS